MFTVFEDDDLGFSAGRKTGKFVSSGNYGPTAILEYLQEDGTTKSTAYWFQTKEALEKSLERIK